jgi:hypothetical protein
VFNQRSTENVVVNRYNNLIHGEREYQEFVEATDYDALLASHEQLRLDLALERASNASLYDELRRLKAEASRG